ncbi:putative methyltransferase type 11 protein [Eutypa lata UCREL1]|uniref:Putative methyltransferase type 11 protein n=1 Tax=Eutypa lata (strain UCR-EL1) TaxID=1287681 RepID=M7T6J0_EUTLA|nr:putative methyltransferase type 11 protein [Eutypa lata UCREL1]
MGAYLAIYLPALERSQNSSPGFVAYEDTTVVPSLVKAARGVVLELGPGPGNQLHRYETSNVDFIYGVEPIAHYKKDIDAKLAGPGLQDRYKLVTCGIEDSDILRSAGVAEESIDTVLSIQVMCAVGNPKLVMKEVYKLLKPGGRFIFWEHGSSKDSVTNAAQGCRLTRNVKADILGAGEWENPGEIEEPVDPYSCLPRIQGVLIKKS